METITIPAKDNYALAATIFRGGDAAVIINSATATPRHFYKAFAQFLVTQGYTVVTYDYRGIGDSAPPSLSGFDATMSEWGLLDMQGVVDWVSAELTPSHLFVIGHSFGGQAMGLLTHSDRIDGMVTASAQSGYWRLQGSGEVWKTRLYVSLLFPILTRLRGYFPWSWFGSAEDLPKGVALQWARWCRDPNYLLGDTSLPLDRYQSFYAPILALSVDDDVWGTPRSVDAMMSAYPNVTRRHIVPSDYGIESIGHFGLFRSKSTPIWHELVAWLQEQTNDTTRKLQSDRIGV